MSSKGAALKKKTKKTHLYQDKENIFLQHREKGSSQMTSSSNSWRFLINLFI